MALIQYIELNLLAAALIEIPIFLVLWKTYYKSAGKTGAYLMFTLYLSMVNALAGLPTITYIRFEPRISLLPFVGMASDLRNSILNVLLFVPLGFLLPVLWERFRCIPRATLWGFALSTGIEFLQIFSGRTTDVNDILTNTLGTILGLLFASLLIYAAPKVFSTENDPTDIWLPLGISAAVMFFLHPFAFDLLWSVLDGISRL